MNAHRAGDERVETGDGEIEDLALARRASIHDPQREGWEGQRFLLRAIHLRVVRFRPRLQGREPTPHPHFAEQLDRRWETARFAVQGTERAPAGFRETPEAVVPLQQG